MNLYLVHSHNLPIKLLAVGHARILARFKFPLLACSWPLIGCLIRPVFTNSVTHHAHELVGPDNLAFDSGGC